MRELQSGDSNSDEGYNGLCTKLQEFKKFPFLKKENTEGIMDSRT